MIKLYLPYFIYGFIVFYMNLFMWGFSNGPANIIPYITLVSSIGLFLLASCLSLFYPKVASFIGLVCIVGVLPFQFSLISGIGADSSLLGWLLLLILLSIGVLGLVHTVKVVVNYSSVIKLSDISFPVKILLALIPVGLSVWWIAGVYFR